MKLFSAINNTKQLGRGSRTAGGREREGERVVTANVDAMSNIDFALKF